MAMASSHRVSVLPFAKAIRAREIRARCFGARELIFSRFDGEGFVRQRLKL